MMKEQVQERSQKKGGKRIPPETPIKQKAGSEVQA